jgi:hypothetical protein
MNAIHANGFRLLGLLFPLASGVLIAIEDHAFRIRVRLDLPVKPSKVGGVR